MRRVYLHLLSLILFASCERQKEIDLKLPAYQSQMSVEGYLEPGQPYKLSILESVSYFELPYPPTVDNAVVTITHNSIVDTLHFSPAFDTLDGKFYNYVSNELVPFDYNIEFNLYIKDTKGRVATAHTIILPPVAIDSLRFEYSKKDSMAAPVITFYDDPSQTNYYRYVVVKPLSVPIRTVVDYQVDDMNLNSSKAELSSSYNIEGKTPVKVSLYNITKEFFDFYNSVLDAKEANSNPFSQPTNIKSNISGGIGIFTGLSGSSVTKSTP